MTTAAARRALARLARAHGVLLSYTDDRGQRQRVSTDALIGVLRARGVQLEDVADAPAAWRSARAARADAPIEPVTVAWDGRLPTVPIRLAERATIVRSTLTTELGERRSWDVRPRGRTATITMTDPLPLGRHELAVEAGSERHRTWVISAPTHACDATQRAWGVFAPVYALASRGACTGDYEALHELARDVRARGGGVVATLPVLAAFLDRPFEPSPYAPASRLFWNELYVNGAEWGAQPDGQQRALLDACAAGESIDYAAAARVQRALLQPVADRLLGDNGDPDARAFAARDDVTAWARFRALCDRQGAGWHAWPARLRAGRVRAADVDAADARYHAFAQWAAQRQLGAIAADAGAAGLYLDMPLGVHPDGYDTWRFPELFARACSAGAPPDALFRGGQDWGFPPADPDAQRRDGYAYLSACLRHQLELCDMLRLDHVMSLYRLYWIGHGLPATEGAYVRYPEDELFAVLTLESLRHRVTIVGEDLGTVPAVVRRRLERHAIRRMFVVQYDVAADRDPPVRDAPVRSVASLNTHDMPTFAGFWAGHDITDQRELGLLDDAGEAAARTGRSQLRDALARHLQLAPDAASPDAPDGAFDALLARLARGSAQVVLVNLEDLWLEERPQNVPGTGPDVRPNWSRRFAHPFPDVLRHGPVATRLAQVAAARRSEPRLAQETE